MQKKSILAFMNQHPRDGFAWFLKQFLESPAMQSKKEEDEISGLEFAVFMVTEPACQDDMSRMRCKMLEDATEEFWKAFLSEEARLVFHGISPAVVNQLLAYPFVDFALLRRKLEAAFTLSQYKRQLNEMKSIWELLILTGKPEAIDAAIKDHGLNENTLSEMKHHPLEAAILGKSVEQLKYLLDKIPALLTNKKAMSVGMHLSVLTCQQSMVLTFLQRGVSVDSTHDRLATPLFRLCDEVRGNVLTEQVQHVDAMVDLLLQHGASLDAGKFLHLAIRKSDLMPKFIRHGIDVNVNKLKHIELAMMLHQYNGLILLMDYGMLCSIEELQAAKIDYHQKYSRNELQVPLQFRKDNANGSYWYCLGMITNKIEHFNFAAKLGIAHAKLRAAGLLLAEKLDEKNLKAVSELITDCMHSVTQCGPSDICLDLLLQMARRLDALSILENIRAECLEFAFKYLSRDTLLTKEGHAAAACFLESDMKVTSLQMTADERKELADYHLVKAKLKRPEPPVMPPAVIMPDAAVVEKPAEKKVSTVPTLFVPKPQEPAAAQSRVTSWIWHAIGMGQG